ncbi:hypothetical protein CFC21_095373 [Triticum aestivum]|uniref:Transcription initiation factor TFIID subunit 8 n=2 Tax=Triticum aestivum TaxID=4565 RepID=A0A9R1MXD4_WHEAT|nr:transcription initiation factor TFIID subunit 8-like [Triticum aestivum]XP_044441031.1 transcription initiation factor TFIID subunit 8-like [Triticum aestivum]KAF7019178.1 hypothetical protein CFC21_032382 [Triticum aestivum]KAF7092924.1 hypothetical protein CFC21_095373 [Triticum aestivum]
MGGGGADEFGRATARAAVARALQAAGFASATRSAVDALADVLLRYLRLLGAAANAHANLAGRSAPNELDVVQFLEEAGEAYQGFEGASSTRGRCLVSSGVVKDLVAFAGDADDKPQSVRRPLPRFPVRHDPPPARSCVSFAALGRGSGMRHVPEWLPAFPEPHTYASADESGEMVGGSAVAVDEVEQVRRQRKAEKSLLGLQRQLALAGGNGIRPAMVEENGAGKGKELDRAVVKSNPFLQSALRYGDKEVSEVGMPNLGKKHSVLDEFAPAFAESEGEGLDEGRRDQDQGQGRKRIVPKERPPVVMALNSRDRKGPWFLEDDRKRRALSILAEPIEKPS